MSAVLRHGRPAVRGQARVKTPTLECFPRSCLSRTRRASGASPRAPSRVNTATAQLPDPRRGDAPRHLAVVRRRLTKGRFFPCLDVLWIRSYRVERWDGLLSRNLAAGEMWPSRHPFGANRRAPQGRL
jgi:hypothetical protein